MNPKAPKIKPVKFLVCMDDTEHARIALRFACSRAQKRGGAVDVIHVIDTDEVQSYPLMAEKMLDEKRKAGKALLQTVHAEAARWAPVTIKEIVREGVIGEEILKVVEDDLDANMLVLGMAPESSPKGRSLVSWLTNQLGKRLQIPIMVVPGNLTDLQIEELS